MKARIGEAFNRATKETLYQLQFKLGRESVYKGYSYDMFKTKAEAKSALEKHESGARVYEYNRSIEKIKRTQKGNVITVRKVVVCHVMSADYDLESSIIWAKVRDK